MPIPFGRMVRVKKKFVLFVFFFFWVDLWTDDAETIVGKTASTWAQIKPVPLYSSLHILYCYTLAILKKPASLTNAFDEVEKQLLILLKLKPSVNVLLIFCVMRVGVIYKAFVIKCSMMFDSKKAACMIELWADWLIFSFTQKSILICKNKRQTMVLI